MKFEKNIKNTAERIARFINHTPLQYSPYLSKIIDGNVYLKLENIQKTGSFKFRGAMSKISSLAMSKNPKKVIISEYLLASEYFLEKVQIGYLNAILDKLSKVIRKDE